MLNFDDLENSYFRNLGRQSKTEGPQENRPKEGPHFSQQLTPLAKWLQENAAKNYTHLEIISKKTEADFLRENAIKSGENLESIERKIKLFDLEKDQRVFNRYRFDDFKKGENLTEYWNRWANYLTAMDFSVAKFYRHVEIISEFNNRD
jgi:hypothetical protein